MLDARTLALCPNGLISLNQELIEYAYDHDYQVTEMTTVVSMTCVDNYLALVTCTGVLMLLSLQSRKLKLVHRFTTDTNIVTKALVCNLNSKMHCLALVARGTTDSQSLVCYEVPEPFVQS